MRGAYRVAPQKVRINAAARGRAVVQVLNADGAVDQEVAANNLILSVGIEGLKTRSWAASMENCVLGTGTTATSEAGGTSTADQNGQAITLPVSTGFTFNADLVSDVGKIIKWASGQRARIISVESTTTATAYVGHSQTVPAGAFTVYAAQQTISDFTEVRRDATLHTAGSGCGTSIVGNVVTHKRTFDFPAEVGSVTYNEIGLSHSSAPGGELFSRIKLATGLSVVALQSVRVVYTLDLTIDPDTSVGKAADITGWPVAPATDTQGDEMIQLIGLARINASTGATEEDVTAGLSLEPYATGEDCAIFLSNSGAALALFGSAVDRTGTGTAVKTNTALDPEADFLYEGYCEKYAVFAVGEGNATDWQSIGVGKANGGAQPYVISGFVFVFDQDQTKDSLHTLELRFAYTWIQTFA